MSNEHAFLQPSAAGIWGGENGCRLYPTLHPLFFEKESEQAIRGRIGHDFGRMMIEKHIFDTGVMPIRKEVVGSVIEGITVDHEIYDGAQVYASYVVKLIEGLKIPDKMIFIERRVSCPDIHPEMFGTGDIFITGCDYLCNIDYKGGRIPVMADGNLQQTCYLSGMMSERGINGLSDQSLRVVKTIIQPFANDVHGAIRTWVGVGSDLRNDVNILKQSAIEVYSPDPIARSGEHCRFCDARYACSASLNAMDRLYEAAVVSSKNLIQDDAAALAANYSVACKAYDRIKKIRDALGEKIESQLRVGKAVPGYQLESVEGSLKYAVPPDTVIAIGAGSGIDLSVPKVLTPLQAIGEGMPEAVIQSICTKTSKMVVTEQSTNKAKEIFYGSTNP